MPDRIIYFILDCLDTMAIYFLMMSIFQYPVREYLREAAILCCILATASIVGREVLGIAPLYDLSIHIALLIFGLRFLMKVRLHRATRMVGVGAISLFAMQILVVSVYTSSGLVDPHALDITNSWGSRSVQMTTQGVAYTIAYLVVVFDLGVTKFVRPPHDFYVREMTKEKRNVVLVSVITLLGLSVAFYYYIVRLDILAAFVIANILFLIVLAVTYRKEKT